MSEINQDDSTVSLDEQSINQYDDVTVVLEESSINSQTEVPIIEPNEQNKGQCTCTCKKFMGIFFLLTQIGLFCVFILFLVAATGGMTLGNNNDPAILYLLAFTSLGFIFATIPYTCHYLCC